MSNLVRVVVAIITDDKDRILITQRVAGKPQSDKWEFPGGKISLYETGLQALKREVMEEVNIHIESAMPFMQIYHDYKDYSVLLDIWQVEQYTGKAKGMEGQNIAWSSFAELPNYDFLEANPHIIRALRLPRYYFKMENHYKIENYLDRLETIAQAGFKMVELGANNLSPKDYAQLLQEIEKLSKKLNIKVILNTRLEKFAKFDNADGISLLARDLHGLNKRPVDKSKIFCVWCNDLQDIVLAENLEADFVIITSLEEKDNASLGWHKFQQLALATKLPVFVDGEVEKSSFSRVRALGGLGVVVNKI